MNEASPGQATAVQHTSGHTRHALHKMRKAPRMAHACHASEAPQRDGRVQQVGCSVARSLQGKLLGRAAPTCPS